MHKQMRLQLPRQWPAKFVPLLLDIAALTQSVMAKSYAWCSQSQVPAIRQAKRLHRAECMTKAQQEIIRIFKTRLEKIPCRKRPYYDPEERMAILLLREQMNWSIPQTAKTFLLDAGTIRTWLRQAGDNNDTPLLKPTPPVNKFPDIVGFVVTYLKRFYPNMGKRKIAHLLTAAGLVISISTVGRLLNNTHKKPPKPPKIAPPPAPNTGRVVTARYPNHVWHIDLTIVPTNKGMATRLFPHNLSPIWPFAWTVATVVDHLSRKILGTTVFYKNPTARQVYTILGRVIASVGQAPKYIISDKGSQFWCAAYKTWCKTKHIKPRFGAVGLRGSIAIIERFFRSLKTEFLRKIMVPLSRRKMLSALKAHQFWFNKFRPHQGLGGARPDDIYDGSAPKPTPINIHNPNGCNLKICISHYKDWQELPVIEFKKAA